MRIVFALLITAFISISYGCSDKTDSRRKYSVGIVQYMNTNAETLRGFYDGMRENGFIKGKNTKYINFGPAYTKEEIKTVTAKVIKRKPDIIFTSNTPATVTVYKMTKKTGIPVVFAPVSDPVSAGIIKKLSSPGENITGVRLSPCDCKRLEWLKIVKPDIKNVLVPYDPRNTSSVTSVNSISKQAGAMGINLIIHKVSSNADMKNFINNMPRNIQAVFIPRDAMVISHINELSKKCIERKTVLSTPGYILVKAGAAMGYGLVDHKLGKQAARMAASILHGADPGDIPVETAEDYLFINKQTIKAIGLNVDTSILNATYKE